MSAAGLLPCRPTCPGVADTWLALSLPCCLFKNALLHLLFLPQDPLLRLMQER